MPEAVLPLRRSALAHPAAVWARMARPWAGPTAHSLLLDARGVHDLGEGSHHHDFEAWCALHPGQRCTLWLGAALLADALAEGDRALRAPSARVAWARRVLQHYHGEAAAGWALLPCAWRGAWGVSALRGPSTASLQAAALAHGVQLRAVRPLWPALLAMLLQRADTPPAVQRARRGGGAWQAWVVEEEQAGTALGVTATAWLTRLQFQGEVITGLQRRRLQAPWDERLQGLLDEDPVAADGPHTLLWLAAPGATAQGASAPASEWPQALPCVRQGTGALPTSLAQVDTGPDFLQPLPRTGALPWWWLCTCLAVLAVSAFDARQAWAARAAVRDARAVQAVALPAPSTRPPMLVPAASRSTAALMAQRLAHPWPQVFVASEAPAAAGLRWLAMEHSIGADLRLQGQAMAPGPVHRTAALLRTRPQWQQVLVARLETASAAGAEPVGAPAPAAAGAPSAELLSFEIVARLREARP